MRIDPGNDIEPTRAPPIELDLDASYWLGRYKEAQDLIAAWTAAKDEARSHLETALGDSEVATIGGTVALTWTWRKSSRLDISLLKATHPEAYSDCQTTTRTRYMVASQPDREAA